MKQQNRQTKGQLLELGTRILTAANIKTPRLDSLILLEHALKQDRALIFASMNEYVEPMLTALYKTYIAKRYKHTPVAYIVGYKEFYRLKIKTNKNVLIPRPETEALVEYVISNAPPKATILELGTGSGAIAIAIKHQRSDLNVTASDISNKALSVAKENAIIHNVKINFLCSNLFDSIPTKKFNIIAANLPYLPTSQPTSRSTKYEPKIALYSGSSGLDLYKKFIQDLPAYLTKNGFAVVEFMPDQLTPISSFAKRHGMIIKPITDYIHLLKAESQ